MPLDSFLQAWFPPHTSRALKSDDAPRASCSPVSNNTDMLGSGIAGGNIPHVDTPSKCCELCASHPDCRGWVLHPPHFAKDPATCFLKTSGNIEHTFAKGVTSGVYAGHGAPPPAPPPPPPPPPCPVPACGPPAASYPSPPYGASTFIASASIAYNETVYTGVPSDTWPSVWAASGKSYSMGGDMPGSGRFQCLLPGTTRRVSSFTNSFEIAMTKPSNTAEGSVAHVNMTLLNCTAGTSSLQEVYDVCSGGKPGSVFSAPNLKPVSMLTLDDHPDKIFALVQCTYEGPCLKNSDDPLACDDPTYPACQRGINTASASSSLVCFELKSQKASLLAVVGLEHGRCTVEKGVGLRLVHRQVDEPDVHPSWPGL